MSCTSTLDPNPVHSLASGKHLGKCVNPGKNLPALPDMSGVGTDLWGPSQYPHYPHGPLCANTVGSRQVCPISEKMPTHSILNLHFMHKCRLMRISHKYEIYVYQ